MSSTFAACMRVRRVADEGSGEYVLLPIRSSTSSITQLKSPAMIIGGDVDVLSFTLLLSSSSEA